MQTFNIEQSETRCIVTWRHFSFIVTKWIMAIVFMPILFLIATVSFAEQGEFVWAILTALIGGAVWFWALFARVVNVLFGKTRFVLNENGLETTRTCLFIERKQWIDLTDIRRFEKRMSSGKWGRWYSQLCVVCVGRNAYFIAPAGFLTQARFELDGVCDQLNSFLETLKAEEQ